MSDPIQDAAVDVVVTEVVETILDPNKNYVVLDASKQLLIMDVKDVKVFLTNVAVIGGLAAVGVWSGRKMWERDIKPLWKARQERKERETRLETLRKEAKESEKAKVSEDESDGVS